MTIPTQKLTQLQEKLPLFTILPASILETIDYDELMVPVGEVAVYQQRLEQQLEAYIVTYHANAHAAANPAQKYLCSYLTHAILDTDTLAQILKAEQACEQHKVFFVAYAKPIQLFD